VLLVLLAAEGVTILQLNSLITVHFFIGMLLLGPVALKAGSVIYRFVRYYTGSAPYRRKGPPAPLLRLLGPFVLLTTVGVFGTGIALAFVGPGKGPWLFLHKGFFVVWFCAMTVHVLWYLPRIPRLLAAEFRGTAIPEGRAPDQGRAGGYGRAGGFGSPGDYGRGGDYGRAGEYDRRGDIGRRGDYDQPAAYARPAGNGRPGDGYPGRYTGRAAAVLAGRGVRLSLLVGSLLAGLVIAMLTVHMAVPWHFAHFHH
jgi:hypothetical protein